MNINISNHKQQYKKYLLSEGSKAVKLDQESINSIFDKQHFCETTNAICKIWKTGYDCNSKLAIIQKMKQTYDYLYSTKSEIEISALSGSLNVFFSSIIRALYIFKNQNLTIQLINTCITRVIEFLELSKDTYKNADKLVQGEHFKYEPKIVYNCWKKEKEKE